MVATTDCAEKSKPIAGNRVSKPLMEKKRRARINKCLDQLKSLLESYYSSNIRKRKLEKADILELTVKYLRSLQKIQSCAAAASDFSDYQFGFRGCLANVNQYVLMADDLNGSDRWMLSQLSGKLRSSLESGEVSSTMDSGLLPPAAAREERVPAKSRAQQDHSASTSRQEAQQTPLTKQAVYAAELTQNVQEKKSSCKRFCSAGQRDEAANTQHSVWRPW